ncbi:MAG TPA: AI-2E family transporter [Pyrinomonadaceae bacterium]|jgi:predicted PurR-regulated permease PerM|nr:AI-2E family transporter [Pyrinomonadaceae bacterium]
MPDDSKKLTDLTIGEAKRILVYGVALVLAVCLFFILVGKITVALLLGIVAGIYLLPVQEWLERRLRARAGSAMVTIALIVLPLVALVGYSWYELSGYSNFVQEKRGEIITSISNSLAHYLPVSRAQTRAGLEAATVEALTRSAGAIQDLRARSALLLVSVAVFFFTVFFVLTQRVRTAAYIKLRIPGEYQPFYEKLSVNIGGALRGALWAVFVDQLIKAVVITTLNIIFDVPLKSVLFFVTFMIGFFPLLGEWAIYVPISIYLLVFRGEPTSAVIFAAVGITLTLSSSLLLRPRLASSGSGERRFNFYWMFLSLVSGVYTFGIPGIVLGPATIGFIKAIADTLTGEVRYETSLLKSEVTTQNDKAKAAP